MAESAASQDAQLELKKRARRRLVGAAALALLAAVVLPMVMDHEPRPVNQDIQVRIPSPEGSGGIASRLLPAKPAATPLPPVVPAAEPVAPERKVEAKAESGKPDAKPEPKPDPKHEAKAETPSQAVATPAVKVPEKPAADKAPTDKPAADKPVVTPAEKAAEAKSDEARANKALAGGEGAATQWVVQLGAYKESGNVKLLLAKLKEMGVPTYTEKFDSPQGPRTRVRAGPFPNKDAAEKARAKAKIVGVDGPVAPK